MWRRPGRASARADAQRTSAARIGVGARVGRAHRHDRESSGSEKPSGSVWRGGTPDAACHDHNGVKSIALRLEDVIVLVLNLPATAPGGDQGDDVVAIDGFRGRPSVLKERLALVVGDGQLAPIDPQRIRAFAQGNGVDPAVGFAQTLGSGPVGCGAHLQVCGALEIGDPFIEYGMGVNTRTRNHRPGRAPARRTADGSRGHRRETTDSRGARRPPRCGASGWRL